MRLAYRHYQALKLSEHFLLVFPRRTSELLLQQNEQESKKEVGISARKQGC